MFLSFPFFVEITFAEKGVVFYKKTKCNYFIVETNMGYALLKWHGGHDPDEGDIIEGDFESFGFKDIYDSTADSELRVWVDGYGLLKRDVVDKYFDKCYPN